MRKRWKILTVAMVTLLLMSGLFVAVAAENDLPADPDVPVIGPIIPGETVASDPTEEPDPSGDPTESTDSTEPTESTPTDNLWDPTDSTAPIEPSETEPSVPSEPTVTTTTTTRVTRPRPTETTTERNTPTTTTTTETTDEIIVGGGETTNQHPLFGAPSRDQSQKTPSTDSDDSLPFEIGKVVLYTIIALLIMVGGGVAIYFITKHQATNNGKH